MGCRTSPVKLVEENGHVLRRYTSPVVLYVYRYMGVFFTCGQNNAPPSGVYLMAFSTMFESTRRSSFGSAHTGGTSVGSSIRSSCRLFSADRASDLTTEETTSSTSTRS